LGLNFDTLFFVNKQSKNPMIEANIKIIEELNGVLRIININLRFKKINYKQDILLSRNRKMTY
jgi:hypothetical protein